VLIQLNNRKDEHSGARKKKAPPFSRGGLGFVGNFLGEQGNFSLAETDY